MKKILLLLFLFFACTRHDWENHAFFPVSDISTVEEWTTYEGKWLSDDGIIRFELSLKSGPFGYDSYYKLYESFESDSSAGGTTSQGVYSTYEGFPNKQLGICLHNLNAYQKQSFLRFKKANSMDMQEEMFLMTRGNDELLPCDNTYHPLTTESRYTLHKRSNLFTVEGYFTLEQNAITFFERNTLENWQVANLGEFNELTIAYNNLARQKHEGIYLKALAYSVSDTTLTGKSALVIKRIKSLDDDRE